VPLLALLALVVALYALRYGASPPHATFGMMPGLGALGVAIFDYGLFCDEDSALFIAT
jgi:hypothetical protein